MGNGVMNYFVFSRLYSIPLFLFCLSQLAFLGVDETLRNGVDKNEYLRWAFNNST